MQSKSSKPQDWHTKIFTGRRRTQPRILQPRARQRFTHLLTKGTAMKKTKPAGYYIDEPFDNRPRWQTKQGERLLPADMKTGHLFNAFLMLWNTMTTLKKGSRNELTLNPNIKPGYYTSLIHVMLEELSTRELIEHQHNTIASIDANWFAIERWMVYWDHVQKSKPLPPGSSTEKVNLDTRWHQKDPDDWEELIENCYQSTMDGRPRDDH